MKTEFDNVTYLNKLQQEIEDSTTKNQLLSECLLFLYRLKTDTTLKDSIRKEADRLAEKLETIND